MIMKNPFDYAAPRVRAPRLSPLTVLTLTAHHCVNGIGDVA
jgi:hypothetical protein